jgi:hypothetical protein
MVEQDAGLRARERLDVPTRPPEPGVAVGARMEKQGRPVSLELVRKPDPVGRLHERHIRILSQRDRREVGRAGIEPATLGLRVAPAAE